MGAPASRPGGGRRGIDIALGLPSSPSSVLKRHGEALQRFGDHLRLSRRVWNVFERSRREFSASRKKTTYGMRRQVHTKKVGSSRGLASPGDDGRERRLDGIAETSCDRS
jgi:hypothetical protein